MDLLAPQASLYAVIRVHDAAVGTPTLNLRRRRSQ
jgi:hypothetical protein